jgi:hypothetical protein
MSTVSPDFRYFAPDPETTQAVLWWGLNETFGRTGEGTDWADWLADISQAQWKARLARLLERQVFIFAGTEDYDDNPLTPHAEIWTDRCWQGSGQYEKAAQLYGQLLSVDRMLKTSSYSSPNGSPLPYRQHDAPLDVIFVPCHGMDHGGARTAMRIWLQSNWFWFPRRTRHNPIDCVFWQNLLGP